MDDDNISPTNLSPNDNDSFDPSSLTASTDAPPRPKPRPKGAARAVDTATLEDQGATGNGGCVADVEPVTPVPGDGNAADDRMVGTRVSSSDPLASNDVPPSPPVPDSAIDPFLLSDKLPGDQQRRPTTTPPPPPTDDISSCSSEVTVAEAATGSAGGKHKRRSTTPTGTVPAQDADTDHEAEGRGKRKRVPRRMVHLGASTHPRSKDDGSGGEDDMRAASASL
ncbi:hypothetical protein AAF712_015628 [Marasmius tenuissimus]|uniref:Uncharacterized protein n=1 Tax=Marasmius tenuissimus TaxID=585030 RepID=A0ABR2Z8U7_9AGAR